MQDVFIEYLVKRKTTPKVILAKAGIVTAALLAALLPLALSSYLGPFTMFAPIISFAAIYGGYYFFTAMNVEFEYAVTNGEVDIDKIVAQRKRLRLVTVNCREVLSFGRYTSAEHAGKNYQTRIIACDSPDSGNVWYCVTKLKEKGETLIVFNANEKMLTAIKPFLPGLIMRGVFKTEGDIK